MDEFLEAIDELRAAAQAMLAGRAPPPAGGVHLVSEEQMSRLRMASAKLGPIEPIAQCPCRGCDSMPGDHPNQRCEAWW